MALPLKNIERNSLRIPNLPMGPLVDKEGRPTDEEQTFRQALLTLLQSFLSEEGVVIPSQNQTNVNIIQNNTIDTPSGTYGTPITSYSCQFGTMIYVPSTSIYPAPPNDKLVVAFNNGAANPAPIFKTITVT